MDYDIEIIIFNEKHYIVDTREQKVELLEEMNHWSKGDILIPSGKIVKKDFGEDVELIDLGDAEEIKDIVEVFTIYFC